MLNAFITIWSWKEKEPIRVHSSPYNGPRLTKQTRSFRIPL